MGSDQQARVQFDAAYPRLLTAAHGAIRRFFRLDESKVEDVLAETMARTFERWERVRRHENPTGWVVVCAKNVCLEELRRNARHPRMPTRGPDDLPALTDHAEETALSATIWKALEQLSRRQRDVAVLRYLMDLDEATTAEALGMTVPRVRTAAHEARGRLRALLGDVFVDADEVPA